MYKEHLRDLLARLQQGDLGLEETLTILQNLPYQDLGFAKVDHHRTLRKGFPEVILGQGKSHQQITEIGLSILTWNDLLLVTRVNSDIFQNLHRKIPDAEYKEAARAIIVNRRIPKKFTVTPGTLIVTAGTTDIPIAEEAAVTAELMGCQVERLFDVGVAGIHRLLAHIPELTAAQVIVVVAGMDGALLSVVAGLVTVPVIGVPTSQGYGTNLHGIAPLLTMLNSCSPGTCVVNIDNGFGAGYMAALISKSSYQYQQSLKDN